VKTSLDLYGLCLLRKFEVDYLKETSTNEWKCVKCGSNEFRKRRLRLRGNMGSTGFLDAEEVTAYFCNKCGYIEFYERQD